MGGDIPPLIALEDVREVVTDRRSSGMRALARVDAIAKVFFYKPRTNNECSNQRFHRCRAEMF
jgi:hypothetical protein